MYDKLKESVMRKPNAGQNLVGIVALSCPEVPVYLLPLRLMKALGTVSYVSKAGVTENLECWFALMEYT